jgi:predicted RNA methylase
VRWPQIDFLQSDISWWAEAGGPPLRRRSVDTVVMNPPFGTRKKGADAAFLRAAFQVPVLPFFTIKPATPPPPTHTHTHTNAVALAQGF